MADTQHVPCKFFLQGQCQAGRMCPFSHDVESSTRPAPCKYFARGHCKFGRKCALLHIAPDGTAVNRGPQFAPGPAFASGQSPATAFGQAQAPPPSLLSMQAQAHAQAQALDHRPSIDKLPEYEHYQYPPQRTSQEHPQIDMTYTSASPTYGSPLRNNRFRGSSPGRGLSVLDAPLPSSFDSNGISMAAMNSHHPSSVPVKFGMDSPPSSFPHKSQLGNTALQELHNSAFGGRGINHVLAGSSPPSGPDEPLTFPKRSLHSERLHAPRHQMISASLGTRLPTQSFDYSDDEEGDTDREEGLLPASLRDLIPEGRSKSSSRTRAEHENLSATFLAAQRRTISGHGATQDGKWGSPYSSSPSRLTGLFTRTLSGRSDGDGHVGSPLRNSGLAISSSRPASGELSPSVSSPPRQASMSMLTQELQRTKLGAARSQAAASVGLTRSGSNGSNPRSSLDRALSSNGVGRQRIDEEQDLFDMDELSDTSRSAPRVIPHRDGDGGFGSSRPLGFSPGSGEPSFGAIGGHRRSK